jgi:hypothetical protein
MSVIQNLSGMLLITPAQTANSTASVTFDQNKKNVVVTVDGQSEKFAAGSICTISYKSGSGGRNSFTNETDIPDLVWMKGNNDRVLGGGRWSVVYLCGDDSSYDSQGRPSDVLTYGKNDQVTRYPGVAVYQYSFQSW